MTPEEWLAEFDATVTDVAAKAEACQRDLDAAGATETDGPLSVTVAPNGALTGLRIDDAAWHGSGADLAAEIMRLAREAQRAAALNVVRAFAPSGGDADAMRMLTGYLPDPE